MLFCVLADPQTGLHEIQIQTAAEVADERRILFGFGT